jgi:hypothetical protein
LAQVSPKKSWNQAEAFERLFGIKGLRRQSNWPARRTKSRTDAKKSSVGLSAHELGIG